MLVDLAEMRQLSKMFIVVKPKANHEMGWDNEANEVCEVANLQIDLHLHVEGHCKLQRGWFLFQNFGPNSLH